MRGSLYVVLAFAVALACSAILIGSNVSAHPVDEAEPAASVADSDAGADAAPVDAVEATINDDGSVTVTRSFDTGWTCDTVAYESQTDVYVTGEVAETDGSVIDSVHSEDGLARADAVGVCERGHGEVSKTVQIYVRMGETQ